MKIKNIEVGNHRLLLQRYGYEDYDTSIEILHQHVHSVQATLSRTKFEILPEMPAKVYDKLAPVTVKIICDNGRRNGSGAIIGLTEKGRALILTACHVVASNFEETDPDIALEFYKDITVKTTTDIKFIRASELPNFVDRTNDLAMIVTFESIAVDQVISYKRLDKVKPGQKLAAVGYPDGNMLSLTVGRVTRLESKYLVFDARLAPGSSGGPLVDDSGRMIGVSTFAENADEGYAINMTLVLAIVENWLKRVKLTKQWRN